MLIAEETLEDVCDSLEDEICEGVCDKIGQKDVFERAAEEVDDDEDTVCAHDLQECEVEVLLLHPHQQHVVHHDHAQQEQGHYDQL